MNAWFEEYTVAMYRTRWIGVVGALIVLFAVVAEIRSIHFALSVAEVPFEGDLASSVTKTVTMLLLIGVSVAARLVLLFICKPQHYQWLIASWFLCSAAIVLYLWAIGYSYRPDQVCNDDGRCYAIYDISRSDLAALAGLGFIVFSFIRTFVTVASLGSKARYK